MVDANRLEVFEVNVFHARAELEAPELPVGARVRIEHRLLLARELREARITRLAPFELAWSETKLGGADWFPHAQRLVLTPRGAGRCLLENTLNGAFRLRGARWWLIPWYRRVLARILDAENRRIARATEGGGTEPGQSPPPISAPSRAGTEASGAEIGGGFCPGSVPPPWTDS